MDNRIQDLRDSIITIVEGNLAYTKLIFTSYPNIGIPLDTKNLELSLNFCHDFKRKNLMQKGDKIFSLTYYISYALINSHHSIEFKYNEYISIPSLFLDLEKRFRIERNNIEELPESWKKINRRR